ncbi:MULTISPECIES: DUF983 domain-containing protein [Microvirga]|uniref:DUF983 domain-containing protein n=1 Tax=Microvirga TaxID=186650 RepID=UPI001D000F84|nr:DUF983 domain-containing protein [Microvirga lenta]MCB5176795.1 DUF983 domain-containing protein [Microvirga lenta]
MPYSIETATPRDPAAVPVFTAMRRGFMGRCPACNRGRLFGRFLKVADQCDACGTEFHHHRADDFPPYIVMFVVGHLIGYGILMTETRMEVPMWLHLALWPALTLVLCLALLQPVKGAVVGLQYALGMHGFGAARAGSGEQDGERTRDGDAGAAGTDGTLRVRDARS